MTEKETLPELTTEEFEQLLHGFINRADDRLEPSVFLQTLAAAQPETTG